MQRLFPADYADYAAHVPLFFPRLRPFRGDGAGHFRWSIYRKNREPRALLGAAFVWGLLIAKMMLFP